ncbi:unnamed protein product [Larinioides sclopetarius]|uniref:Uncharacterized protein n=1 Tax=Larinioides sclopetarius TaxID=280406 RepID=A0AAV1Z5F4_9ARAC
MSEITPLLKQKSDIPRYNTASTASTSIYVLEEEPLVEEGEFEVPLLEIVNALLAVWERNGANEELTPEDIMAMHLAYCQVTGGRQVFHAQYAILNKLADAMLRSMQRTQFFTDGVHVIELRRDILKNLLKCWPSIIIFDEDIAQDLNAYYPPTCQERIKNSWMNCIRKYSAFQSFLSHFTGQLLLVIILLGWPLSMIIMGVLFESQCPMNSILPDVMAAIGLVGIAALLSRLVLACIEKWFLFSARAVIPCLGNVMKFIEFIFLLLLIVQLWFFLGGSPSFDSKDPNFCNETFYSFTLWMKYISPAFASIWLAVYFIKVVLCLLRCRYHYLPLFDEL